MISSVGRVSRLLMAVGVLLAVTGCTTADPAARAAVDHDGFVGGTAFLAPYPMPDLVLRDTAGQDYNLADTPSKPVTLMFFGYTHCPDVCLAQLSDVALALRRLDGAERDQIQLLFVTTDPQRDTAAVIERYLARFDDSFVGLTGTPSEIKRVADRVGVVIGDRERLPGGGYDVAHSAPVLGFSRDQAVVAWNPGTPIGSLTRDLGLLVERTR